LNSDDNLQNETNVARISSVVLVLLIEEKITRKPSYRWELCTTLMQQCKRLAVDTNARAVSRLPCL